MTDKSEAEASLLKCILREILNVAEDTDRHDIEIVVLIREMSKTMKIRSLIEPEQPPS